MMVAPQSFAGFCIPSKAVITKITPSARIPRAIQNSRPEETVGEGITQSIHRRGAPAIGRHQIIISDPNREPSIELAYLRWLVGLSAYDRS